MVFNNTKIIIYNPTENCADEEPVDAFTIVIDNSLLEERKEHAYRSTVTHECGHRIYHEKYYVLPKDHPPYTSCEAKNIIGADCATGRFQTDLD